MNLILPFCCIQLQPDKGNASTSEQRGNLKHLIICMSYISPDWSSYLTLPTAEGTKEELPNFLSVQVATIANLHNYMHKRPWMEHDADSLQLSPKTSVTGQMFAVCVGKEHKFSLDCHNYSTMSMINKKQLCVVFAIRW